MLNFYCRLNDRKKRFHMRIPEFDENKNLTNGFAWFGFFCALGAFLAGEWILTDKISDMIIEKKKREAEETDS